MDISVTPGFSFITKDDCSINSTISASGCCVCKEDHETDKCSIFDNLLHIQDTKVPPRALLTLPPNLRKETLADGTKTIIADSIFKRGVQFGPYEAKRSYAVNPFDTFPLKIFGDTESILPVPDCYLDTKNEEHCNWMCYISSANNLEEQNLICYQIKNDIFYSVIRDILPGEQLKVWYSPYYALKIGMKLHSPKKVKHNEYSTEKMQEIAEKLPAIKLGAEEKQSWCCKFCNQIETNVVKFAKHLQKHLKTMIDNSFICDICNAGFSTKNLLIKHKRTVHIVFTGTETASEENFSDPTKIDLIETCMPLPIDNLINETLADSDPSLLMLDQLSLSNTALYNDLNDVDTLRAILCDDNTKASKTAQEKSIADFSLELVESNETPKMQVMQPPFLCDICSKQFKTLIYLLRHLSKHAGEFTCVECLQVFTRKENFMRHPCLISSNCKQNFNCNLCQKSFLQMKYLRRHLQMHVNKFSCTDCGKEYKTMAAKKEHNCTKVTQTFDCNHCEKNFSTKQYLQRHIKNTHLQKKSEPNEKILICEICAQNFSSMKLLKKHKLLHFEPKYVCNICDKKFHKPYVYQNHVLSHGASQYACTECGKKYKTRKNLALHAASHSNKKKHVCEKCGQEFMQRVSLRKHEIKMHMNETVSCSQCNQTFSNNFSLLNHKNFVHNKNQGDYKCSKCNLNFSKPYLLKRHEVSTHSNIIYVCQYCDHSFKQRSSLRRHLNKNHANLRDEWDNPDVISTCKVEKNSKQEIENKIVNNINNVDTNLNNNIIIEESFENIIENTCLKPEPNFEESQNVPPITGITEQQITLGKNAYILDDGTIVQPSEEGNIMFYVISQQNNVENK